MSQYPQYQPFQPATPHQLQYGTDSRVVSSFFNMVYAWMFVGLALTALVAWLVSESALGTMIQSSPAVLLVIALGAFAIAWGVQSAAHRLSAGAATALFLVYAAVIGAMISGIFVIYPMKTLFAAFLMTGGVFGVMSLYGFVTKRDLTRIGSILVMCALGLFAASLVNLFFANNLVSWIITYAVLAVFIGIVAYETQMLKEIAYQTQGNYDLARRFAIVGSLTLYISFINIFLSIVRILGRRD